VFSPAFAIAEPWQLGVLGVLALVGGYFRGYAGFGMSALIITAASVLLEPHLLVPVLYAMEVLASLAMLPGVFRFVDWRLLGIMLTGAALTLPIAQHLLVTTHPDIVRIFLSLFVLICSVVALTGWRRRIEPSVPYGLGIGFTFGTGSGMASIGGLGASLILMTTHPDPNKARASGVFLFAVSSMFAFPLSYTNGLAGAHTLPLIGLLLVPMLVGIFLGTRRFASTDIETFRRRVLWLILGLAIALLASLAMRTAQSL